MGSSVMAQQEIMVGKAVVIEAPSGSTESGVVFEDDGETGYFYGLDTSRRGNPILDALHIYNAASVTEDVRRIRSHPLVPGEIPIYGYLFDVKTGKLIEIPEATEAGAAS